MSARAAVQLYLQRQDSPWLRWRRQVFRAVIRMVAFGFNRLTVSGLENIPASGPLIMMINHTSGLDPGLIMATTNNRFVIPMTKIENTQFFLGRLAVWWWDCYTIRRGEIDRQALTTSIELLRDGQCILIAPEGTRQRQGGLARPKEGLAWIATKADAVILPCAISGARGWNRKWFRLQRPEIHLRYGRPFRFRTEGARRLSRERLQQMTDEAMYQLAAALVDPDLRGAYSDLDKAGSSTLEFVGTA
ncbi:MAG: lysophospholipid acyltransferase family protein [Anaerolineaceae bacterium]|nr:lysophospholipid acyltransferase family protein [Anaerolineaceae bacterium]